MILSLSLNANEIDRMESIVQDIQDLRADYNKCLEKIDVKPEKSNSKYNKLLKAKENEINSLKKSYNRKLEIKDMLIKSLNNQINKIEKTKNKQIQVCKNDNKFPKLMMKEGFKEKEKVVLKEEPIIEEKQTEIKAASFRLISSSEIYSAINGNVVDDWENTRSFTSTLMTQNWIKITGYFIDKKWQAATQELWIEKINTIKR